MPNHAYVADHLFLLMGENPLPNAVAALMLLAPAGTPYLVHSDRTRFQAERLAAVLQEFPELKPARLIDLGENQAEPNLIRQQIQAVAATMPGRIGMNYTGGTKVMAVHAYRALEQVRPDAVFSYLDSNTLELVIDQDAGPGVRGKASPKLMLDQLFRLHGLFWQAQQPPLSTPIAVTAATRLAHLFAQSGDLANAWRSWCRSELRPFTKNEYYRWKPEAELAQTQPLRLKPLPPALKATLWEHLGATGDTFSLQTAHQQGFTSITQLCEWLDGLWLEHYTLSQIQQAAATCGIHDSRLGFRIQDPMMPRQPWAKFEFDVACMRHYQIFALSCTTTNKHALCKQKLMEARVRSRQLGGTEARVALVCSHARPERLRSELEVVTRDKRIAVFGQQDLPTLGHKIARWIEQNG